MRLVKMCLCCSTHQKCLILCPKILPKLTLEIKNVLVTVSYDEAAVNNGEVTVGIGNGNGNAEVTICNGG